MAEQDEFALAVQAALGELDGTTEKAVELLTGATSEELEVLGGFGGPPAKNVCPQCGGTVRRWYAPSDDEGDVEPRAQCDSCEWGF